MSAAVRYLPVLIVAAAYVLLTRSGFVSPAILPRAGQVGAALWGMLQDGELLSQGGRSLARGGIGLGAAILVGTVAGLLMQAFRPFRLVANPIVQSFYPPPKSALIPVLMLWLGLGDTSKIAIIFLGCLLPIVVSTYNGARGVNPVLAWSAASFGASRADILRRVVLPGAMPEILNGIRTALAFAFILMISSELVIATNGLGYLIGILGDGGAYPAMFAAIIVVSAAGFVADRVFGLLMRRQLRRREP